MAKPSSEHHLVYRVVGRLTRLLITALGVIALIMLVLAFTHLPWKAYRWFGEYGPALPGAPDVIVMMGGGGIPSESGLMRTYETAVQAKRFPKARVIVATPHERSETNGQPNAIVQELLLRGVERGRITQAGKGRHTREQASEIWALTGAGQHQPAVLLVSSPEHVRRSVMAFQKAGFTRISGAAVYSEDVDADLSLPAEKVSGIAIPNPVQSYWLRYRVWDNLGLQLRVLREWVALQYYRLKGWA
jgi:uncharacterized SAM-binding protein YcdF (DUF218 family)